MRDIIFRGKDEKTDEWVYGFCTPVSAGHGMKYAIITGTESNCFIPVFAKRETIGQYTGLTDKNGTKIFEGDIVKCTSRFDAKDMVVIFETAEFHLVDCQRYKNYTECCGYRYFGTMETEVIGNIHDNPELPTQGERHGAE